MGCASVQVHPRSGLTESVDARVSERPAGHAATSTRFPPSATKYNIRKITLGGVGCASMQVHPRQSNGTTHTHKDQTLIMPKAWRCNTRETRRNLGLENQIVPTLKSDVEKDLLISLTCEHIRAKKQLLRGKRRKRQRHFIPSKKGFSPKSASYKRHVSMFHCVLLCCYVVTLGVLLCLALFLSKTFPPSLPRRSLDDEV